MTYFSCKYFFRMYARKTYDLPYKKNFKAKGDEFPRSSYAHDAYADNTLTVAKKTKTANTYLHCLMSWPQFSILHKVVTA